MATRLYTYDRLDTGLEFSVEFIGDEPTVETPTLFTCCDLPSRPTHLTAKFTAVAPKKC